MLFKMQKTLNKIDGGYVLPSGYEHHNVLLVGVKSTNINALKIDFKVYANENGIINKEPFDGYYCHAQYNQDTSTGCFDIDGNSVETERFFSRSIHTRNPVPLSSLRGQQLDTDFI